MKTHHIFFVSDQTLPIILGTFLPGNHPEFLHAIVTDRMQKTANVLQNALHSFGRNFKFLTYKLVNNPNQYHIHQILNAIAAKYPDDKLIINVTGGTKLMSLAAAEWAHKHSVLTFYVDTAAKKFITLDQEWKYDDLPDVLTVSHLLQANGYTIIAANTNDVSDTRRLILLEMLKIFCADTQGELLCKLNSFANAAAKSKKVQTYNFRDNRFEKLLICCAGAGMITKSGNAVRFNSEDAYRWCNGIWLEEYVRMVLIKLEAENKITSWGSEIIVQKDAVNNEIDALFSHNNRLYVIECKTTKMKSSANKAPIFYKADSLNDRIGGIFSKSMLCTVRTLSDRDLDRAKQFRIKVVSGYDLLSLADILLAWM